MKFRVGDIANGVEISSEIVEFENRLKCLEHLVERAGMYCNGMENDEGGEINGEFRVELAFDVVLGKAVTLKLTDPKITALIKQYLNEGLDIQVFFPDYEA